MTLQVSEILVNSLSSQGVDHVFIVAGGNVMYVQEAIRSVGIRFTAFHNEQAAVMAAEGYARVTGKLGVAIVTSGPGAANTVTGIAGAFLDSAPVLVIAGQAKSFEQVNEDMKPGVRQVGTFELPMVEILKPITKLSIQILPNTNIVKLVEDVVELAISQRPGPIFLEIPLDVQNEIQATDQILNTLQIVERDQLFDPQEIKSALENELRAKLKSSRRPLLVIGHGVRASGLSEEISKQVVKLGIPVVTTQLAKDFLEYDSKLFIGHFGLRGDRPGNLAIFNADLQIVIGSSLQQQNTGFEPKNFAPNSNKIIIDFQGSVSKKKLAIPNASYFNIALHAALEILENITSNDLNFDKDWLTSNIRNKNELAVKNEPHLKDTTSINLYEFVEELSVSSPLNAKIVVDAGLCFYAMGQGYRLRPGQRYIVSGGLGSMGYALPAAIGAALANNHQTCAVIGDGSMQMNVQELATISRLSSDLKIFVINNGGYASIRNTQSSFFNGNLIGSSESSGVSMPNWKKLAEAYGIKHVLIDSRDRLASSVLGVFEENGPLLIEVMCQEVQRILPYIANFRDADGLLKSDQLNDMSPKFSRISETLVIN